MEQQEVKGKTGIEKAVDAAGGQVKMAAALGVTQQAVSFWVRRGYVAPLRAIEIEMQWGVPRIELISQKIRSTFDTGPAL